MALAIGLAAGLATWTPAGAQDEDGWDVSGDLRVMYTPSWRDTRAGQQRDDDALGARFRLRLARDLAERWRFQARFAASALDQGNDPDFFVRSSRADPTAIEPGSATFDELFVEYRSSDTGTRVRLGRQQSTLTLPLITSKSLDRNQASNINIGWTDGISIRQALSGGWYAEAFAQYHSHKGNGFTTRGPLVFDDSGSRIGWFGVVGSDENLGPVFMRALTLTVFPDTLASDGTGAPRREDYVTATAKMAAGWGFGASGQRLVVAGALGHALNRPRRSVVGLPGEREADGWSWHVGADLVELFPRHSVGLIYGRSDAGWLISNDYRQNDELAEFRWQWQVTDPLMLEFRARWRRDLDLLAGSALLQRDRDMRVRATWRF